MKKLRNQSGQAAIEFMVSVVVIFFFLFFFLSITVLIVTSEYLDYAVFMAARTYKAGSGTEAGARDRALDVLGQYTSKIQGLARNFRPNFTRIDPSDEQTAGVEMSYEMDLFYLPPVFLDPSSAAWQNRVSLTSESHLGRDPGQNECKEFFTNFLNSIPRLNGDPNFAVRMDDNGC